MQVHTYAPEPVCRDISIQYITLQRLSIFLFSIFFSSYAQKIQKRKLANKLLFSPQEFFKCIFNFFSLICVLHFCLVAFCDFWCFLCVQNLFVKTKKSKKNFKTALITSFILLLNLSHCKHKFLNHYNFFITIFFNYHNLFIIIYFNFFSIIAIFFNYYSLFQLSRSSLLRSF